MGNRRRLDADTAAQLDTLITDALTTTGHVPDTDIALLATAADRSTRQIRRLVETHRNRLGLATARPDDTSADMFASSVEAFLAGAPFRFDDDMRRVALAYAGNLRRLRADAAAMAATTGAQVIGYSQLTRKFNAEIDNATRRAIRQGIAGFKKASLYTRWSAAERNEVWQIDATQLDIWVTPKGTTTPVRPWALFIIDDRTRVIMSSVVMFHDYNAADSAACVHRAIHPRDVTLPDGTTTTVGGLPGKILCDNALQFTGELLSTVAMDLGFVMWAVAVYMGEKKGKVERLIRSANEELCRMLPGYANPNLKTFTMKDALKGSASQALSEAEFLDELGRWVEKKNNSPHPTIRNKSRYEVWADDPTQLHIVADELLQCATVPVSGRLYVFHKDGFGIQRNHVTTTYTAEALAGSVGDRFHLRHLPGENSWVDAYDPSGRFVARCWDSTLLTQADRTLRDRNRFEEYRRLTSLRSDAVELRAVAAADTDRGGELTNPLAVAAALTQAPAAPDLVAASLGMPSSDITTSITTNDTDSMTSSSTKRAKKNTKAKEMNTSVDADVVDAEIVDATATATATAGGAGGTDDDAAAAAALDAAAAAAVSAARTPPTPQVVPKKPARRRRSTAKAAETGAKSKAAAA